MKKEFKILALSGLVGSMLLGYTLTTPSIYSKRSPKITPAILAKRKNLLKLMDEMEHAKSDKEIESIAARHQADWDKEGKNTIFYLIPVYHRRGEYARILTLVAKYPLCQSSNYFEYEDSVRKVKGGDAVKALRRETLDGNIAGFSVREQMADLDLDENQIFPYMRANYFKSGVDEAWQELMASYPRKLDVWFSYDYYLDINGRRKEIYPLYDDWYRHADPKQKEYIKSKIKLDYKRLDNEDKP